MDDSAFANLTPRERECLRGVRALMGSGEIADRLGIATGTVDTYLQAAKGKLGARDRKHAALLFAEYEAADAPQKLACENLGIVAPCPPLPTVSAFDEAPPAYRLNDAILDQRRFGDRPAALHDWRSIFREIAEGARPDGLSMLTRGSLILAATVVIGFAFFAISAGVGALYGIAILLRSLSS